MIVCISEIRLCISKDDSVYDCADTGVMVVTRFFPDSVSTFQLSRLQTIADTGIMPLNDFFDNISTLLSTSEKDGVIRRESIMGKYLW